MYNIGLRFLSFIQSNCEHKKYVKIENYIKQRKLRFILNGELVFYIKKNCLVILFTLHLLKVCNFAKIASISY